MSQQAAQNLLVMMQLKHSKKELLPLATVITPNIPEAEVLADEDCK